MRCYLFLLPWGNSPLDHSKGGIIRLTNTYYRAVWGAEGLSAYYYLEGWEELMYTLSIETCSMPQR